MVHTGFAARLPLCAGLAVALGCALPGVGQVRQPGDGPLPRYLTAAEKAWMKSHPPEAPAEVTPPPVGPLFCPGEYWPSDGILVAWSVAGSFKTILNQMVAQITTTGKARAYVVYKADGDVAAAKAAFGAAGADLDKVEFVQATLDSLWIRDYGPRYAYEGDTRIIIDHVYNRPRPHDDAFPSAFSFYKGHTLYGIPLVHGGGNYHISDTGRSFCTRLVDNENNGGGDLYDYTEPQIHDLWTAYQGADTAFLEPFPHNIDETQHLDMWMQIIGDTDALVSDWPLDSGSAQDVICDSTAAMLEDQGWTIHRVPAFSVGGVHYTYCNVLMCNDLVLVPTYTNGTVQPYNEGALAVWREACPGKTVVGIDCQAIIPLAGAMHCIAMHVPVNKGGANPTAFVRYPHGGEEFKANDFVIQEWNSDDDKGTTSADIYLSTDGGQTYPDLLAGNIADTHAYYWSVPDVSTSHARIKVVLHDADGNTGSDESGDFTIGTPCYADFTGDGTLDLFDFLAFQNLFVAQDPGADCDANGSLDLFDFLCFVNVFNAGC